jgi:signal transduction histidine kinase
MIKHIILFTALSSCCMGLRAQNAKIDSLNKLLIAEKTDTGRVNFMFAISIAYINSRPDTALAIARQGLALARKIDFKKGEALCLRSMGNVYNVIGNYPKSLEAYLDALKTAEELKDNDAIAILNGNIADNYFYQEDMERSIEYSQRAIAMLKISKENDKLKLIYGNLGDTYEKINQLDSAIIYTNMAYAMAKEQNDDLIISIVLTNLGNIYVKWGKMDSARLYYQSSITFGKITANYSALAESYLGLAKIYLKNGQADSLLYYARQTYSIGKEAGFNNYVLSSSLFLSDYYKSVRNFDSAYTYQAIAMTTKDSLFNQQKSNQLQSLTFGETLRQQEVEAAREQARVRVRQNTMMGGLFTLVVVAFLLYRNNRIKQKANKKLAQTLNDLKSTQTQLIQSEKMASLGELTAGIAHEIQNPLNFVTNFSEVNKELVDEMKEELATGNVQQAIEIANDIKANEEKINHHGKRADAIVKGMLQHSQSSTGKKEPTDINALCDEFFRLSYHGLRAKDKSFNATMKTDYDKSIGSINIIPQDIGRVILNLINNAFYAVNERHNAHSSQLPAQFKPTVLISTKKIGDKVEIKVTDNGNGIHLKVLDKIFQPFFTTKPTGQGTGLGLSMSYDIVTKGHGGELKVETREGEGTDFIILLPV